MGILFRGLLAVVALLSLAFLLRWAFLSFPY